MPASFDDLLAKVHGRIHVVNFADDYAQFRDGLLYYWNRAEILHNSAKIIWDVGRPLESDVAAMLIGMAIELLLKGTRRALDLPPSKSHRLDRLCDEVGITISANERIILKALSEHVIWASRYTVPTEPELLITAQDTFDKQRRKSGNLANYYIAERATSLENCERLWTVFADHYHRARDASIESVELHYS
jgi:hypothetical protein